MCVLPDGRLASGGFDGTLRLWDVGTGVEAGRLEGHSGWISALCVLPDGRLASGSYDNTIRLWDVKTAKAARPVGHSSWIDALCVLTDGRVASGARDCTIRLWDIKTAAETDALRDPSTRAARCARCPTDALPRAVQTAPSGCGRSRLALRSPALMGTRLAPARCVGCPMGASP